MFLHRKLIGTFVLCARLRARLDVRERMEPWLAMPATGRPKNRLAKSELSRPHRRITDFSQA